MAFDLAVAGTLVLSDDIVADGWVAVKDGRIASIGSGSAPDAKERFDAGDAYIFPGIVDGQTHAGSYGGLPGIRSTTASAVAGGVTTIVDMPYDNPDPLNTCARLRDKVTAIATHAHCDVALYGTVLQNQDMSDVVPLIEAGVVAFKISAFETSPTRFPRIGADQTLSIFEALAPTDVPLGIHNEDQEIVHARIAQARAAGLNGIAAHSASRPLAAELASTAQFLEIGATAGAHAHIVHLTAGRGFQLVDRYRQEGYRATGELCVHYLWFDPDQDADRLGALMKVNPPIRPGMRDVLWAELAAGRVAFVSSDHSSWPVDNKSTASIFDAGAGVPGLETLLPAFFTGAEEKGFDAPRLVAEYLCERPANFFGIGARKGAIKIGADADLTIFSREPATWNAAQAHDELCWSPYDGRRFSGQVMRTYLRGALAWDGTSIINSSGAGRYLPRNTATRDAMSGEEI